MPRSIAGHGRLRTRYPPPPGPTSLPCSSHTAGTTPGNGRVAEPGLSVVTPGSGVMRISPVSADVLAIPDPSLRVDRFADGAEQAQAREIVLLGVLRAPLHVRADRRR